MSTNGRPTRAKPAKLCIVGKIAVTRGDWFTGEISTKHYTPAQYAAVVKRERKKLAPR